MKTYSKSIRISALPDRVWSVLTEDLPRDPAAFGILRLEGTLTRNGKLKLWSEVDPKRAFKLRVIALQPPHEMIWQGGMPLGLFTGTRTFELSEADGITTFRMKEVFSGLLSGLIVKSIPDLNPSFEKFAQALKEKAENHG